MLKNYSNVWVIEDHFPQNGMFNTICEIIAENKITINIKSLASKNYTLKVGNSSKYFWEKYSLDINGILEQINKN